eukprot:TRINITY_DN3613_c2_g1_i1.p1 TRINITY_DN3613_c2_g1~~TRINITY_DN3613_c2_g1_i1.p1  ORF type:complete len:1009 (+),score=260.15 TRINITY_DN3613_c2_g1_i1:142-3168(+)
MEAGTPQGDDAGSQGRHSERGRHRSPGRDRLGDSPSRQGRQSPSPGDGESRGASSGRRSPHPLQPVTERHEVRRERVEDDRERWRCGDWLASIAEEVGFSLFFRFYIGYHLLCSITFAACWGYHTMVAASSRMFAPPLGRAFWMSTAMLLAFVLIMTFAVTVIDMLVRMFVNWLGFARDSANLFWIPNAVRGEGPAAERKTRRRRNYMLGVFEIATLVIPFMYALIKTLSDKESILAFIGSFSFLGFVIFQILVAMQYIALWVYSIKEKFRVHKEGQEAKRRVKEFDSRHGRREEGGGESGSQAGSRAGRDDDQRTQDRDRDDRADGSSIGVYRWMRRHRRNPIVMSEFGMDVFSARAHTLLIMLGLPWVLIMLQPVGMASNLVWMMIIAFVIFGAVFTAATIAKPSKDARKTAQHQDKVSFLGIISICVFGFVGALAGFVGPDTGGGAVVGFVFVLLLLTQGLTVRRHGMHVQTPFQARELKLVPKPQQYRTVDESSGVTQCLPLFPCSNVWRTCCDCPCLDPAPADDYVYNCFQMETEGAESRVVSSESRTVVQPPRQPGFHNTYRRLKTTTRHGIYDRVHWDDLLDEIDTDEGMALKPPTAYRHEHQWHNLQPGCTLVEVNGQSVTNRAEIEAAVDAAPEDFDVTFKHGLLVRRGEKTRIAREAHLDRTERVLNASLKINLWYFVLFFPLVGIAFSYGTWFSEPLNLNIAVNGSTPHAAVEPYAACSMKWNVMDLTLVDFAFLAQLSYHSDVRKMDEDLMTWFGWKIQRKKRTEDEETAHSAFLSGSDAMPVTWFELESPTWNQVVILIEGTTSGRAWLRDLDIWGDAVLYQILCTLNPFWALWDEATQRNFVAFLGFPKSAMVAGDPYKAIEEHIRKNYLPESGAQKSIVIVGHAAAGGHAKMVAQRFGVPVVAFAPPGTRWTSQRLGFPHPLRLDDVTVAPERSMMPMVDRMNGFVQETHCNSKNSMSNCQRMENILCDLLAKCGDPDGRSMTDFDSSCTFTK